MLTLCTVYIYRKEAREEARQKTKQAFEAKGMTKSLPASIGVLNEKIVFLSK